MPSEDDFSALHYGVHTRPDFQQQNSEISSYEPYSAASAYSSAPQLYYTAPRDHMAAGKVHSTSQQRRYTPAGSPSPSISQALDYPPSALSSASGASVQSTASSAVGSPYSHATNTLSSHDQWKESRHGLGIAPEIVHNDGFGQETMFPMAGMENDLVFDGSKLQSNFVGEFGRVSSSSFPSRQPSPTISSSPPALQPLLSASSSSPGAMGQGTFSSRRNVTIDTILEEVNSEITSPEQTIFPTSARAVDPSFGTLRTFYETNSPPVHLNSFKSPTTPASAMSPYFPSTDIPSRTNQRDLGSQLGAAGLASSASPTDRFSPYQRPIRSTVQDTFSAVPSQNPFFSQSSGRFIPPLESSCWFSWLALIFYSVEIGISHPMYLFIKRSSERLDIS